MITKFKIFESELIKDDNNYIGKFFITPYYMREYEWKKEDFYITLVTNVAFYWKTSQGNRIWPRGDTFTIMKNGDIKEPAGWGYHYTDDEFKNINFMTSQELYENDKEFCEKLYSYVNNQSKTKHVEWYDKMLKNYKNRLESVPELQYLIDSEKYNL